MNSTTLSRFAPLALVVLGCCSEEPEFDAGRFMERFEAAPEAADDVTEAVGRTVLRDLRGRLGAGWERTEGSVLEVDSVHAESPGVALASASIWSPGSVTIWGVLLELRESGWSIHEQVSLGIGCGDFSPAAVGRDLFGRLGCLQCHPLDEDGKEGPTLRGMFGESRPLSDGSEAVADGEYVRRVLFTGARPTLEGWKPTMPLYRDRLHEREIEALIEYLKTLE